MQRSITQNDLMNISSSFFSHFVILQVVCVKNYECPSLMYLLLHYMHLFCLQVLFYLVGRRWDEPDPPPSALLPCVRAIAIRDTNEAAPSAGCRLVGPSGICVVRLEIPPAWFTPLQVRKRPPEVTLPSVVVYYSIIPVESVSQECPSFVNEPWRSPSPNIGPLGGMSMGLGGQWNPLVDGGLQDMQKAGSVLMTMGPVSVKGERLRLDENVEVLVPPSPVRLGKTVAFGVYMKTNSNTEQFTLRSGYKHFIKTCWALVLLGILSHFTYASVCL